MVHTNFYSAIIAGYPLLELCKTSEARLTRGKRGTDLFTPQEVGLALGAQAGEKRLADVLQEAGFDNTRRAAETPFNIILEVRG